MFFLFASVTIERVVFPILWLGEASPGDWVYAVLGQAREKLTVQRVAEINLALDGLAAALQGGANLDAYFPDLTAPR